MPASRPARGGGRWVSVEPERLVGFFDRFAVRHGELTWAATPRAVTAAAADGTGAECEVPFPPLADAGAAPLAGLVAHAVRDRRVGVLLVRRGGFAVGIFDGARLVASKVGSRHVQGRAAAGGWSQQRFARRREGQARVALQAAGEVASSVLLPATDTLDALVAGGDRAACDDVLRDPRLRPLLPLLLERRLDVPDPRLRVLEATPVAFRAVPIRLLDPDG